MKILVVFVLLFSLSCSQNKNFNSNSGELKNAKRSEVEQVSTEPTLFITKEEYGDKWSFTVDKGLLRCEGSNGIGVVTFENENKVYAVNGLAKQKKKYLPIEEIWADNGKVSGTKKDMSAIINKGLSLCK